VVLRGPQAPINTTFKYIVGKKTTLNPWPKKTSLSNGKPYERATHCTRQLEWAKPHSGPLRANHELKEQWNQAGHQFGMPAKQSAQGTTKRTTWQ